MSSSSSYKCMYLIPRDQYEQMHNANRVNTVDSGIGGDINDSNVQNIDVSEGGTLVINDTPGDLGTASHPTIQPQRSHYSDHKKSVEVRSTGAYPFPIAVGNSSPPQPPTIINVPSQPQQPQQSKKTTLSSSPPSSRPTSTKSAQTTSSTSSQTQTQPNSGNSATQQQNNSQKAKVNVKKPSLIPPSVAKKSSDILRGMVEDRVAELSGRRKKRRKVLSDGDLDRAVVHDIRDASRQTEAAPSRLPPLGTRRTARYRAQVAKIRPYVDATQPAEQSVAVRPTPAAGRVSGLKPELVPLPISDSDDSDLDLGPAELGAVASARTRPRKILYARRAPAVVKRTKPLPDSKIDPFHYEPRQKILNSRRAAVRKVGTFARTKRVHQKTEDEKRWESLNFPRKRHIVPVEPLSSGDEDLNTDQEDS